MNFPDKADIPGFSRYFATSDGDVVSRNYNHTGMEMKLSGKTTKDGYIELLLRDDNGKRKYVRKHILIARAYIPNPYNKPQVNHKDGDKFNCRPDNLEWVTQSENIQHGYNNNLYSRKRPILCITPTGEHKEFQSIAVAGRELKLIQQDIYQVCKGKMHSYKGYKFSYID